MPFCLHRLGFSILTRFAPLVFVVSYFPYMQGRSHSESDLGHSHSLRRDKLLSDFDSRSPWGINAPLRPPLEETLGGVEAHPIYFSPIWSIFRLRNDIYVMQ